MVGSSEVEDVGMGAVVAAVATEDEALELEEVDLLAFLATVVVAEMHSSNSKSLSRMIAKVARPMTR